MNGRSFPIVATFVSTLIFAVTLQAGSAGEPRWATLGGGFQRTGSSKYQGPVGGGIKWKFETGGAVVGSVTVGSDGRIHVACEDGKLYTLSSNGKKRPLGIPTVRDRVVQTAVVVEEGEGPDDPPKYSRSERGTPQDGVISPLLANLYLHWFDDKFHREGRYLHLTVSEPALQRVRDRLKEMTGAPQCFTPIRPMIERINRMLRGWQGYFSQGHLSDAYRDVDSYTQRRRSTHLRRRSQRAYKKPAQVTWGDHLQRLGWTPLQKKGGW